MGKLFLLLVLFQSALHASTDTIVFSKEEKAFIQANQTIVIGSEIDFPPFSFSSGQTIPTGYSVELLDLISKKIGIKFEAKYGYTWAELIEMFKKREVDLLHSLVKTPDRQQFGVFSNPIRRYKTHFIVRDDSPELNQVSELIGKVFAVSKSWAIEEYFKKNHPEIKLLVLKNIEEKLDAVARGDAYAMATDDATALYMIKRLGLVDLKISGWFKAFDSGKSRKYHYMVQKHQTVLLSLINKGLDSLTMIDLDQLNKKWFGIALTSNAAHINVDLTLAEQGYLEQKTSLRLCVDPNWMPFDKVSKGKHVGIAADYFKLIQENISIPIEVVPTSSWSESLSFAKLKKCDLVSMTVATEERQQYLKFTEPYLKASIVVATKSEFPFILDFKTVQNKSFGIPRSYAQFDLITSNYPNLNIVEVESVRDGLQKVLDGEISGYIGSLASIGYLFKTSFSGDLKIAGKFDEILDLRVGVRNDDEILLTIMKKLVSSIDETKISVIFNKHVAINYEKGFDYDLFIQLITIIVFFVVIFISTIMYRHSILKKYAINLKEQANHDPMTHLCNRRYFAGVSEKIIRLAKRERYALGVMILDIDNFKEVNDTYGHSVGDKVIILLAQILTNETRASDVIARWGGEEFVLLLPYTNKEDSYLIASKLRSKVENKKITLEKGIELTFTISVGVACVEHMNESSVYPSIDRADKALYIAKETGRNKVISFTEE